VNSHRRSNFAEMEVLQSIADKFDRKGPVRRYSIFAARADPRDAAEDHASDLQVRSVEHRVVGKGQCGGRLRWLHVGRGVGVVSGGCKSSEQRPWLCAPRATWAMLAWSAPHHPSATLAVQAQHSHQQCVVFEKRLLLLLSLLNTDQAPTDAQLAHKPAATSKAALLRGALMC
jgi:hypothetical protein